MFRTNPSLYRSYQIYRVFHNDLHIMESNLRQESCHNRDLKPGPFQVTSLRGFLGTSTCESKGRELKKPVVATEIPRTGYTSLLPEFSAHKKSEQELCGFPTILGISQTDITFFKNSNKCYSLYTFPVNPLDRFPEYPYLPGR